MKQAPERARFAVKNIDHIVLVVKNIKQTTAFYSSFLGSPETRLKDSVQFLLGKTRVFFILPYKKIDNNTFQSNRIGLNHLAFAVNTKHHLKQLEETLNRTKIKHSGIKIDTYGKKEFIWFDDPDGIRLEFYLRTRLQEKRWG